ncbi:calcium-binding protein [Bacillus sp. IITD106]|nr:calcium-binding protein [Bacillus sp. IITD106]
MSWNYNDEQDRRILEVILDLEDELDILKAWRTRITQVVKFHFTAKIVEFQEKNSIVQQGDLLKIHSIDSIDDKYGIIVHTRLGRKKVYFPLCDLEAIDLDEEGRQVIDDYAVWFANR